VRSSLSVVFVLLVFASAFELTVAYIYSFLHHIADLMLQYRCNDDKYHVFEFVHNVLTDVMRKAVLESNHRNWGDHVKMALLECCIALSSACAKGLVSLEECEKDPWSPPHHLTPTRKSDVLGEMLQALSWTFELHSSFAETFPRNYRIPPECMEKVHDALHLVPPKQYPAFTTAIAAKFQEGLGFHLTLDVCPL
jgi:hypothetical protein